MLAKRIIACLDVRDGKVVKGTKFRNHEVMGDILELAIRYRDEGADELVFYDIVASADGNRVSRKWVSDVARILNIPFCVAGGIRTGDDAAELLYAGADKISINSPAIKNPKLINELSQKFGQQCIVVGIDSIEVNGEYEICCYTGRESTTENTRKKTIDWIKEVEERGAGEIVLNCMDRDGTGAGYDLNQLSLVKKYISIPLVASGGAKVAEDFVNVFKISKVDAALAAGVFHRRNLEIPALKRELANHNIQVRL